jgi:hypothetical protein
VVPGRLRFDGSIARELHWHHLVLRRFSEELSTFNRLREEYESALLTGDTDRAQATIATIVSDLGCSLWTLDAELLLAEDAGGLAANRDVLRRVRREATNSMVKLHANFFGQRAEKRMTHRTYHLNIESFLGQFADRMDLVDFVSELRFRLHFATFNDPEVLPFLLSRTAQLPLVDQYEAFVTSLQILASDEHKDNLRATIRDISLDLSQAIPDSRLELLAERPSPNLTSLAARKLFASALDHYTTGNYHSCVHESCRVLERHPNWLELYELVAKAHAFGEIPFTNPFPAHSVAAELLQNLFELLNFGPAALEALETLTNIATRLQGTRLGFHLLVYLRALEPKHRTKKILLETSASLATPRYALVLKEPDAAAYLDALHAEQPGSTTVQFFNSLAVAGVAQPTAVPVTRRLAYAALAHFNEGRVAAARELWEQLAGDGALPRPQRAQAVAGLFECYLHQQEFEKCAALVAATQVAHPTLMMNVDLLRLLHASAAQDEELFEIDPTSWAILHQTLSEQRRISRNTERLNVLMELILERYQVSRPSALVAPSRALIFILRHVCTTDVLDHSYEYRSTDDLHQERIAICQLLSQVDQENADSYSSEIFRLVQGAHVNRALQHLAETKVGLDIAGLVGSLGKSFEERHARFTAFSLLSDRQRETLRLDGIDIKQETTILLTDASFAQFVELFVELKNKFLHSNEYGLDSRLSVRIRHGTLSGQLRRSFETEHLVTKRNSFDDRYDLNSHWRDRFSPDLDPPALAQLDSILSDFSTHVDAAIREVKDNWIQIRTPQMQAGVFDYDYSLDQTAQLFARAAVTQSYESFVETLVSELYERTSRNLDNVVEKIRTDLTSRLTNSLDSLATSVRALVGHHASGFQAAINRCRTHVSNDLEAVAAWFRLPSEDSLDDYNAQVLIETAIATTRTCFSMESFAPAIKAPEKLLLKGTTFVPFGDLLFILLGNILQHSGGCEQSSVTVELRNDEIVFLVANSLPQPHDAASLEETIERLNALNASAISAGVTRKEGGSGYHKLHKILRYDLKQTAYTVTASMDQSQAFSVTIVIKKDTVAA